MTPELNTIVTRRRWFGWVVFIAACRGNDPEDVAKDSGAVGAEETEDPPGFVNDAEVDAPKRPGDAGNMDSSVDMPLDLSADVMSHDAGAKRDEGATAEDGAPDAATDAVTNAVADAAVDAATDAPNATPCTSWCGDTTDGCCPTDCNEVMDLDCSPMCGNGWVETGELCDTGAPGSCPTTCEDWLPCTQDILSGLGTCVATCANVPIEDCGPADSCCPSNCDSMIDVDCANCGNGVVEMGELCDWGTCPLTCDDADACTMDSDSGLGTCQASCSYESITACIDDDSCCLSICSIETDNDCPGFCGGDGTWQPQQWRHVSDDRLLATGLGIREPPNLVTYSLDLPVNLPDYPYFSGTVKIPVLLVDWGDFDPTIDENTPNGGSSVPSYVKSTREELETYLNGPGGLGQYVRDISGNQADLQFDVIGWIQSPGEYLRGQSEYEYRCCGDEPTGSYCHWDQVFLDALKEAIVSHGLDVNDYDSDCNGVLDGAVYVYEGVMGLCGQQQMLWLTYTSDPNMTPQGIDMPSARNLVATTDPNYALFATQDIYLQFYVAIPERDPFTGTAFVDQGTWAHELGHLFLGYPDYYYSRNNMGMFALSGEVYGDATHPSAWEKWLLARWIEPEEIVAPGTYTLATSDIADGTTYDAGPYIAVYYIDGDPNRFLTIENRYFDSAGNAATAWAPSAGRDSGLTIVEFDWSVGLFSDSPVQVYRHTPSRVDPSEYLRAFQMGDIFSKCFATECLTVEPISIPGPRMTYVVEEAPPP